MNKIKVLWLDDEVENLKNSDLKKSLVDLGLNIAKDSK